MAHDVFLSHSSKDKAAADAACNILERNGIRVWMAPRDIMPGMGWAKSIIGGIAGAKVMVLMFSSHANASPQVEREVERAINKSIPIVPFRVENVQPNEALEYFISSPHWLDAFTPPIEQHFERLVLAVKHLLASGYVKAREDAPPEREDAGLADTESGPADDVAIFAKDAPQRNGASDAQRRAIQEESIRVAQAAPLATRSPAETKDDSDAGRAGATDAGQAENREAKAVDTPVQQESSTGSVFAHRAAAIALIVLAAIASVAIWFALAPERVEFEACIRRALARGGSGSDHCQNNLRFVLPILFFMAASAGARRVWK